jgi:hypothetical protein
MVHLHSTSKRLRSLSILSFSTIIQCHEALRGLARVYMTVRGYSLHTTNIEMRYHRLTSRCEKYQIRLVVLGYRHPLTILNT